MMMRIITQQTSIAPIIVNIKLINHEIILSVAMTSMGIYNGPGLPAA